MNYKSDYVNDCIQAVVYRYMFTNSMALILHVRAINRISACIKHVVRREGEGGLRIVAIRYIYYRQASRKYQRDIQLVAFKVSVGFFFTAV